ncbi:MAG: class I SAM-dependent methyltransferase [Anaerolineaceae bacterium]|nr:class I SAM-dependent methyltransferase [Anaerolineaceae bacterium]
MLAFHLDPNTEAASRRPETIQRTVDWLVQTMELKPGHHLLDLGCGPGLYAARLAKCGLHVTGVDFSQNSIDYAVKTARETGLDIDYRCQDYLSLNDESRFDAALLIYGDFCPLSPDQRARLLDNVHRALKPGGYFALDVSTPLLRQREGLKNGWYAAQNGFWKPGPHLVLEQGFAYEGDIFLDQYIVIEETGKISIYRNWFQDYTANTITTELKANGFAVESLWGDLTGAPVSPNTDWIGVIARRE